MPPGTVVQVPPPSADSCHSVSTRAAVPPYPATNVAVPPTGPVVSSGCVATTGAAAATRSVVGPTCTTAAQARIASRYSQPSISRVARGTVSTGDTGAPGTSS